MSKIHFNVDGNGLSILVEPEEANSESSEMTSVEDGTTRQFIDKYGNVWTGHSIFDLAFEQMIRGSNRLK